MALAITLNIIFATFVVVAIVGGLAWSILRDRRDPAGAVATVRTPRPAVTLERRPLEQRRTREAHATS